MFISCQLLPQLQMYISFQLLPSFQYFTLFRLLNNIKKCVGQVRVTLAPIWLLPITSPTYQLANNQLAYTISQLAFTICQLADTIRMSAKWPRMPSKWPVCRRVDQVRLLVSWPSTTVGKLTKGIGELTFWQLVPKIHTGLAIQISNVSLILLPVPRKEFCSLDTPHKLFLLQTFPLSTKGWTKYNIKFRKINKKDEKSWAW